MTDTSLAETLAALLRPALVETIARETRAALEREARPAPEPAPLLSIREAATRCSCSTATIRRAIQGGRLPAVRSLGRRPLVRPGDLDVFLSSGVRS